MVKKLKKILLAIGIVALMTSFVACTTPNESTPSQSDSLTSESIDEQPIESESQECSHSFGEWVEIREATCISGGKERRTCSICGEKEDRDTEKTGHTYEVDYTCIDRTCIVEDCGFVQVATSGHAYGDWETVDEATCFTKGSEKRACSDCGYVDTRETTVDHQFGDDGVCTACEKDIKELFIEKHNGAADPIVYEKTEITVDIVSGTYNIISKKEEGTPDAYAVIKGSILTALKELGYETLTFTVINPGRVGLCDATDKCKSFMFAAESTSNLWSKDNAIEYWGWKEFWDIGGTITFTIDLNEYAGTDLYIYTSQCGKYPTVIKIADFIDTTDPSLFMRSGTDNTTTYYEGKGWVFTLAEGKSGQYAFINANIVQSYIKKGCDTIKIAYKNNLGIEGLTNDGTPVNAEAALLPEKATGGNDWYFFNGVISQIGRYDAETDTYYTYINLTDENYDFEKDIELYFKATDIYGKLVTYQYIASVEFMTHNEHDYVWTETVAADCVNAGEETGVCLACKDTITNEIPVGNHNLNEEGNCTGCGKHFTELLFSVQEADDVINYSPAKGLLTVSSTNTTAYVELDGNILKELKDIGYEKLTLTARNTAPSATEEGWKTIIIAADKNANLWSVDTAIVYYAPSPLWDVGGKFTIELDLNVYSGRKIILYSDKCENYATEYYFSEFIDYTHPEALLNEGSNGTVEYVEGLGWHIAAADDEKDYYANIPENVIAYYVANGYNSLRIVFAGANGFNVDLTDRGNPVNVQCAILPEKAEGGNDWYFSNSFISKKTPGEVSGTYYVDIDLTDANYDFTKSIEIYFKATDVNSKKVCHSFITAIDFIKVEEPAPEVPTIPEASEDPYGGIFTESADSTVEYYEGYGWKITANEGVSAYNAYISAEIIADYIAKGYTTLSITYVNDFAGNEFGNVGNFINSRSPYVYKKLDGSDAWVGGEFISSFPKDDNGGFVWTIDLTDATYDFTKGVRIYFGGIDVGANATPNAFFSKIEFGGKTEEPEVIDITPMKVGNNAAIEVVEGKGWQISAVSGSGSYEAYILGEVVAQAKAEGYTTLTIKFVNSFGGETGNVGAFIRSNISINAIKAADGAYGTLAGKEGWLCVIFSTDENGAYVCEIDLTDETYDYSQDIKIYFGGSTIDGADKITPNAYISTIEFGGKTEEPEVIDITPMKVGNNAAIEVVEGKGWQISAVSGSGSYEAYILGEVVAQAKAEGYTTLTIKFVNSFGGETGNVGAFIRSNISISAIKAADGAYGTLAGKEGWLCVIFSTDENGAYVCEIDLTDETYDYSQDIKIYFGGSAIDGADKITPNAYISTIEFGGKEA